MEVSFKLMKQIVLGFFPSVRAYLNFVLIWVFLAVMLSATPHKPSIVVISSIGVLYCFNEWIKEMEKNGS